MAGEKAQFDTTHSQPIAVSEVMTPFTKPVVDEGSTALAIGITNTLVKAGEKSSFDKSKGEVEKVFRDISKLRDASNQNRISSSEARTRTSAIVKKASAGMPWRATDFRKAAGDYFGAYGEGWGDLDADKVDGANEKHENHLLKMVISRTGKHWRDVNEGDYAALRYQLALEHDAEAAKNRQSIRGISKSDLYDSFDTQMKPKVTGMLDELSKILNSFQGSGQSVAEMLDEGMPMNSIINQLSNNDTDLDSLASKIRVGISQQKAAIIKAYNDNIAKVSKDHGLNFNATETATRLEGLLAPIKDFDIELNTVNDKKALVQFVSNLEQSNKGRVEAFKAANMQYNFMREMGLLPNDLLSQYMLNRERVSDPVARGVIDDAMKNVSVAGMSLVTKELLEKPENLSATMRTNPEAAMLYISQVKERFPVLLAQGYSKDPRERAKQERFLSSGSHTYLHLANDGQPGTVAAFEKVFFDKNFLKMFQGLDPKQQAELLNPIKDKIQASILNQEGTGLINRIKSSMDSFSGTPEVVVGEDGLIDIYVMRNDVRATKGMIHTTRDLLSRTPESQNLATLNKYIDLYQKLSPKSVDTASLNKEVITHLNRILGGVSLSEKPKDQPHD